MTTYLVTGGAGFIGSNFVRYLLEAEADVRVVNLDALTYAGSLENLRDLPGSDRHEWARGDIGDTSLLLKLLRKDPAHRYSRAEDLLADLERGGEGPADRPASDGALRDA